MKTDYPERYITLGLKIAYYRKKRGYTQENLAEKVGISLNFLAQVEGTGTIRGISLETVSYTHLRRPIDRSHTRP